jgi:uncharacterized membrane protein YfcA
MQFLYSALIGLGGGLTSGLFGVGGGIIMVPAMIFFLEMNARTAIGTSLAVIIPTAIIGTYQHNILGNVQWKIALALIPTAVIGGFCGAWLTKSIPVLGLKRAFGCLMLVGAVKLLTAK